MRTVSFSEPKVRNAFNNCFVNTFTNTYGDPTAGKSIKHRPSEPPGPCIRGNGKQNVQTIFMTPEGEILHVATGYQSSEDLLEESRFALELFNSLKGGSRTERATQVVQAHRKRLGSSNGNQRSSLSEFDHLVGRIAPGEFAIGSGNRNGSRTRLGQLPGQNMLQRFTQLGVDADQQFSIEYPLLGYKELENDPAQLVGNGSSFFGSSSGGTNLFSR